jgi:hypothetical protein
MTERILGPTGSQRRKRWLVVPILLVSAVSLFWIAGAMAVHDDGYFELDGNAVSVADDGTPYGLNDGEDWDKVCPSSTPPGAATCLGGTTATAKFFSVDDAEIYTGGSTKDDLDVTGWQHTAGSVPDKDELLHGFAARYSDHLYFGADRAAANGDAQMGVWFFRSAVGPVAGGGFSGAHTDGDVLVLSDFTKGGGLPTVRVFEWNGPGGAIAGQGEINGTLHLLAGTTAQPQDCLSVLGGDPFCATVNATVQPSPWAFTPKSGAANSFGKGMLYEGGIDLAYLGLADECFSSVILETRSSQSVDAVLKDFVSGGFESCGAAISITPSGVNAVGGSHTFNVDVTKKVGATTTGVAGVYPTVTLTGAGGIAAGDISITANTCVDDGAGPNTGTDANGRCSVTFTSTKAGTVTGHASATVTIGTTSFPVETNGQNGSSGDAVKTFVDANITIAQTAVNEVNNAHVFTITVTPFAAGATVGTADISATLAPSVVAPQTSSTTCTTGMAASGGTFTCTLTVNSPTAATFTANASATVNFSSTGGTPSTASVTRSTSGTSGPGGSGPATKRFVDGSISITPNDTNGIKESHTFTITATAIPSGATPVTFNSITPSVSPAPTSQSSTCGSSATWGGSGNTRTCTLTINSDTATTYTANASTSITMGTVTVTRSTASGGNAGPGGSGAATKIYIAGTLRWLKKDQGGALLGGATFQVCRTHDFASATSTFTDIDPDVCVSVLDNSAPDADATDGEFQMNSLVLGRYTIKETAAPAGYTLDPDTETVNLTVANPDNTAAGHPDGVPVFVDVQLYKMIVITCDQSTNTLVASQVTLTGFGGVKNTLTSPPAGITAAQLCGLGGASYGDLNAGTYNPEVIIPKP